MLKFGIDTLTEDELALLLHIVNEIRPSTVPPIKFDATTVKWFRHEDLCKKVAEPAIFEMLKPEGHAIFSALLTKMGIEHEIKYETKEAPTTGSIETQVTSSL